MVRAWPEQLLHRSTEPGSLDPAWPTQKRGVREAEEPACFHRYGFQLHFMTAVPAAWRGIVWMPGGPAQEENEETIRQKINSKWLPPWFQAKRPLCPRGRFPFEIERKASASLEPRVTVSQAGQELPLTHSQNSPFWRI